MDSDKLKVAHITWEFPSLTETFVANEAEALAQLNFDVKIVAFEPPLEGTGDVGRGTGDGESVPRPSPLAASLRITYLRSPRITPHVSRFTFHLSRALSLARSAIVRPVTAALLLASSYKARVPLTMLDRLLALQRLFESEPFDLVHAQFGYVGHLCVPVLSWFKSLPLIVSFRGQDASALPLKLPGLYAPLFRRGNLFLARSEAMRRDLLAIGCPPEKVRVHHSGIDLAQFPYRERHVPDESEPLRILFVGRLIAKKGVLDAVAAFAEARRHHPNIQLRIIGEGPLREQIAREAAERNSAAAILLLGPKFHAEVASEMAAAHIFLLPSRTAPDGDKEGIPNALMEAMASGLPVLSTRHAGIPECVADGVSGLLVPEGDVQALAERLQWLIQNPQRWADMGRAARAKIAAEFNRDIQAQRLISIYKEVLTPS